MKPCQEYEALISAVADGEATEAERRALMEHLSRCADCREAYTQSLLLHDVFSQWEEEAPEELLPAVMEQVRREPRQKARPRRSWMPLLAAAACLALIVVGFQVSGTLQPAVQPTPREDAGLTEDAGATAEEPALTTEKEAEEAKDPEPQVGSDVTQYGTGVTAPDSGEEVQPRTEGPQVTAFSQDAPVMTVTCADPALLTWMETNVVQAGQETEEGMVWRLPVADWLKLEVRLQEGGCIYETAGAKVSDQLVDGDLVEVIYQTPEA